MGHSSFNIDVCLVDTDRSCSLIDLHLFTPHFFQWPMLWGSVCFNLFILHLHQICLLLPFGYRVITVCTLENTQSSQSYRLSARKITICVVSQYASVEPALHQHEWKTNSGWLPVLDKPVSIKIMSSLVDFLLCKWLKKVGASHPACTRILAQHLLPLSSFQHWSVVFE